MYDTCIKNLRNQEILKKKCMKMYSLNSMQYKAECVRGLEVISKMVYALGALWGRFGTALGLLWSRFGAALRPLWGCFGKTFLGMKPHRNKIWKI